MLARRRLSRRASQTATLMAFATRKRSEWAIESPETREVRSSRNRSRLEITPFHPYLQGEGVSRKGAVASSIAWLHRDEYIPEVHGSSAKADT